MYFGKQPSRTQLNAVDDEGAHVAALALTEVLQRGGSPQISRTPGRRVDHTSSPVKSSEQQVAVCIYSYCCIVFVSIFIKSLSCKI